VVVCDGLCPRCGRPAPLGAYIQLIAGREGCVVVDDTQAIGILGPCGGGTARHLGIKDPGLLVLASFAKGFGAPIAALAGSASAVAAYERASGCRVHSSPPSAASMRALDRAVRLNAHVGDVLRARLWERVQRFRSGVGAMGLRTDNGVFPVQAVSGMTRSPAAVHGELRRAGVRTVLRAGPAGAELCFVLGARHRLRDIDRAVTVLARASSCR
jgi:8-amino-7-oxononanoate synthase